MAVIQETNDPYEELALAICLKAIDDYKRNISAAGSTRKAISAQMANEPMLTIWGYFMKGKSFDSLKEHFAD